MEGLSKKEIKMVSYLELNEKFFFTRKDIKHLFKSENELNVYLYRLKKKRRLIKLNKTKYCLIPVKAFKGHWSEHPFIIADETFNSKDYCIAGMAAAHYWGLIDQIPTKIEVWCTKKQGTKKIFGIEFVFKRRRFLKNLVTRKIKNHSFKILEKRGVKEWLKLR